MGHRQQPPQHELGDRHLADARPVDARVDPVARAGVEVLLGGRERHLRPDRAVLLDQHPDQPVVEGGVGEDVDDGRAGGQHAVLHAQVRAAADDVVDGPVPAVDRCRCAAAAPAGAGCRRRSSTSTGSSSSHDRQQRREVADVLLEEVEDRGDPALAEPHARAHALGACSSSERVSVACSNSAMRVSRHSSLPKKNGELAASASCTPAIACAAFQCRRERVRVDLQVQLHARARRLGRDRVGERREPLDAVDARCRGPRRGRRRSAR